MTGWTWNYKNAFIITVMFNIAIEDVEKLVERA